VQLSNSNKIFLAPSCEIFDKDIGRNYFDGEENIGETVQDIHRRKNLSPKQKILDFMNSQKLIASLFRISLA
jgi:hypothetical protein